MTSTLTQLCLSYVANHLSQYEEGIPHLPEELASLIIHHKVSRKVLTDEDLLLLLTSPVTHLDLSGSDMCSPHVISQVPIRCPILRELNLSQVEGVDDPLVASLLHHARNLIAITIEGSEVTDRAFRGDGNRDLVPACHQLTSISLRCPEVSPGGIAQLGTYCPRLQSVAMNTGNVKSLYTLPSLFNQCPQLTRLRLERLDITDEVIGTYLCSHEGASRLQYLSLAGNEHVSDQALMHLSKVMHDLRAIKLVNCLRVNGPGLVHLMNECPNISRLNLKGLYQISYHALKEILVLHGHRLHSLNLGECEQIDDELICLVAQQAQQLQALRLDWCEAVTDESIEVLVRSLPHLRKLSVRKCNIGEVSIRAIGQHCPQLLYLDISRAGQGDGASSDSLVQLALGCPQLQTLIAQWMLPVDDDVMQVYWRNCPELVHVDLEGCKALTGDGMPMVPVPKLRTLSLTWCNEVDDIALLDLSVRAPNLEIRNYYGSIMDANLAI